MMMYVIGMSHAVSVLKAASVAPLALDHANWATEFNAGQFFDVPAKPELVRAGQLKAFIVSHAINWGSVAEMRTREDGSKQVVAVEGFVKLLESLEPVQEQGVLFSFMHGNEHSMLSLVQHAMPYDFRLPWLPEFALLPGVQPIPFEIIHRQMAKALAHVIGCVAMMRSKLPGMRIVHVMAPPPIETEAQIKETPEVFREKLMQSGVTPLSIRLKYYWLAARMLTESLRSLGAELLTCPPEAVAPSGAIKEGYAFGATHGNEAYGEIVLRQMQSLLAD